MDDEQLAPYLPTEERTIARGRRWWLLPGIVTMAAALAGGGVISTQTADDVRQDTPESAVQRFLAAADASDLSGVVASLTAAERDAFSQALAIRRCMEIGVATGTIDESELEWLNGLEETEELEVLNDLDVLSPSEP